MSRLQPRKDYCAPTELDVSISAKVIFVIIDVSIHVVAVKIMTVALIYYCKVIKLLYYFAELSGDIIKVLSCFSF